MALHDLPRGLRRLPPYVGVAGAEQGGGPGTPGHAAPAFSNTLIVAGTTTQQALPTNKARRYLLVQNRGANDIYLVCGGKAAVNTGLLIAANGGAYEPFVAPSSSIHVITASGTSNVVLIEGVG